MYTQVTISLLLVGCAVAFPRTYQEQRQLYYTQPIPVHQRLASNPQLYVQQRPQILQVPAATSLLPDNINGGMRYGQHQVLYVVPSGTQVYYEEQGTGEGGAPEGGNVGIVDTFLNFVSNNMPNYFPFGGSGTQKPAGGAEAGAPAQEPESKPEKPEKPEKIEQPNKLEPSSAGTENLVVSSEQISQNKHQLFQPHQQLQPQPQPQPLFKQQLLYPYQQQQQFQQHLQQQQPFDKYITFRNHQLLGNTPGASGFPQANLLYYDNAAQLSDYNKKPGAAAIAFQRYLSRGHENHVQTTTEKESNENEEQPAQEGEPAQTEELGPSIAQAKPQAVSVAGPGGVAAAAPVGTAIVGPGGMALSAPQATAVAGTKPKPANSDKVRTYFPRNSAAAAFYPY